MARVRRGGGVRGLRILRGVALLCVPILVHDEVAALTAARAARDAGADLVELRIDEFFAGGPGSGEAGGDGRGSRDRSGAVDAILRLVAMSPLPVIVTCRLASEGGGYEGDEADRISLLERLANTRPRRVGEVDGREVIEHPPRYIDVEHAAYTRSANIRQKIGLAIDHPGQLRDLKTSLILSTHDFQGRPGDLHRRVLAMAGQAAAAVVKVAYRARSIRDSLEILDLPALTGRPTIALGMGEFGLISRILAPKFGGFLTFASLRPELATAPGQPTVRELLDLYRFRSIGRATAVYGVVGWPVGHSLSPAVHNAGFDTIGHDGVYVPMPIVGAEDVQASYASFKATMLELIAHPRLTFRGCSVTIPHKQNLLRLAQERGWGVEPIAAAVGAANTLVVENSGGVRVLNTDAPAAVGELRRALGELAGRRLLVLGAGGMARAVVLGAASQGAHVRVWARREASARELCQGLTRAGAGEVVAVREAAGEAVDAVVHCTPVGMRGGPEPGGAVVEAEALAKRNPGVLVMDSVYRPVETPLLGRARALGLRTLDGVGVFVAQAALQFEAWTGRPGPAGLFERIVREQLGSERE